MDKPAIRWVEPPGEGIMWVLRNGMTEHGFPVGDSKAPIVCFSAGDPFWRDQPHDHVAMAQVLNDLTKKVIIVEKHEYGWSNYAYPHIRQECAWLGVENYGATCEVSSGTHGHRHLPMTEFVRSLVRQRAEGRDLIYFRREFFRDYPYPSFVYPINFSIPCIPPVVTYDEWKSRPLDVICVWGETHDHRRLIGESLRKAVANDWFKGEIRSPVYAGDEGRLPGGEGYRTFHAQGRLFLESDGHGLGGGRSWELINTLGMVRKRSWMLIRDDFHHGDTCLEFGTPDDPKCDEMIDTIRDWLARPRELYDVYRRGHEHAARHHHNGSNADFLEYLMAQRGWIK